MRRLIISLFLFTFGILFLISLNTISSVYSFTIEPLLDEIVLKYDNLEWKYCKPKYSNFYFDKLRQEKEIQIKAKGIRNVVIELKNKGLSDIDIIEEIYPNFKQVFNAISQELETEFKECEIDFKPNSSQMFNFKQENIGKTIDTNDLLLNICAGNNKIELKIEKKDPKFKKAELEKNTKLRSRQTTSFAGSESGRRFNIIKALDCFNGLVVYPNEEISFSNILNKNDNGLPYHEATVIMNGEFVKGIGGGICQASTTIYNAVLMAGLEILEVHNHTLPVGYVERGFDAMVNDNGIDLRFRNNTKFPIYLKTYSKNNTAYAEIYGEQMNFKLKKVSEQIERIEPPEPKIIPDEKGEYEDKIKYKGEYYTKRYAQYGYKVNAYLEIYENEILKEKKLIRKETYAPTQSIIYEGTEEKDAIETTN